MGLVYGAGVGLLGWAVFGLRAEQLVTWRWLLGALLVGVGALVFNLAKRRPAQRESGVIIAPEGLVVISNGVYRFTDREQVHEARFDSGRLTVVYGDERRVWCLFSASPEQTEASKNLARRQTELAQWHELGTIETIEPMGALADRPPSSLAVATLKGIAGAVGLSLFVWVTAVLPSTSDSGQATRRFVDYLAADRHDEAYAMLSERRRAELPRERFEASLPEPLRDATGITINGISGGVGTVVGAETCVDGFLGGVEGYSGYAFELVTAEDGTERIDEWRSGQCRHH